MAPKREGLRLKIEIDGQSSKCLSVKPAKFQRAISDKKSVVLID